MSLVHVCITFIIALSFDLIIEIHTPPRMFGAFTLDSILSTAFGRITDVQSGKEDRLSNAVAKVFSLTRDSEAIHPLRMVAISSMQLI